MFFVYNILTNIKPIIMDILEDIIKTLGNEELKSYKLFTKKTYGLYLQVIILV